MNVSGPHPPLAPLPRTAPEAGAAASRPQRTPDAGEPAAERAAAPSLWELLTSEEREFFSQQASLGPLTYRPDGASREGSPAPTGQRIDVRG
jgi:hypothetical protein